MKNTINGMLFLAEYLNENAKNYTSYDDCEITANMKNINATENGVSWEEWLKSELASYGIQMTVTGYGDGNYITFSLT